MDIPRTPTAELADRIARLEDARRFTTDRYRREDMWQTLLELRSELIRRQEYGEGEA